MTKRNKLLLTIILTAFVALSTCLVVSAQSPETDIDTYGSSPNVIVTAYKYSTEGYQYSTPLWQYQAYGFSFSELYPEGNASGGQVAVFFENYYNEYDLSDLYDNMYNFSVQIITYKSTYEGIVNHYTEIGSLQNAIDENKFPLSRSDLFVECIENAYYNQFTYWENRLEVEFDNGFAFGQEQGLHTGYANGYNTGYNDAISDSDAYLEGLFAVFDAPFVFLENLGSFEVFGITIIDVITFLLIICFALFIYKVIRRFLPI